MSCTFSNLTRLHAVKRDNHTFLCLHTNSEQLNVRLLLLLLLLLQHYNPGWVLAFSTSLFHSFLFILNSFQFFTLSTSISLRISILGSSCWAFSKWYKRTSYTKKLVISYLMQFLKCQRYDLDNQEVEVRLQTRREMFLFSKPSKVPVLPPIQWTAVVKGPRSESDRSPSSGAKVKNKWSYNSTLT